MTDLLAKFHLVKVLSTRLVAAHKGRLEDLSTLGESPSKLGFGEQPWYTFSQIPPQMANFHTFFLKDLFFLSGLFLDTLHTAILC